MAEPVPVAPSLRKRFYEPLILLHALRTVYRKENKIAEPDLEGSVGKSPQHTYFCFLNKLSQICDSQPKQTLGKTVSALVILDPGTIEYRLASNRRDARELDTVREYLASILRILGDVADDEVNNKATMDPIFSGILQKVLAFNRPRIENYMEALTKDNRLAFCIQSATDDGTDQGTSAAEALRGLQPHLDAARNAPRLNHDEFARHSEALLQSIDAHYEPCLEEYMKVKTRGENITPDSPWYELRHALGRLLSYFIAIKVLIRARKFWPRLFVGFEVTTIPSSEPLAEPPVIRRSAEGIIRRMGRNQATLKVYQDHAKDLQGHGLDRGIRDRVSANQFRPIVHAEVHLLDSVLRDEAQAARDGDGPLRFFNEADFGRYIGSSKPTCLLCRFYFAAHPAGVACRDSHENLYYNWRAPDVFPSDGPDALRQRNDILEAMVKDVRNETGRAIHARTYPRRNHDSRDTPSDPLMTTTTAPSTVWPGEYDLASRMGQVNLDASSMRAWSDESRETTPDSVGTGGPDPDNDDESRETTPQGTGAGGPDLDEDDDDDGGGVRL